MASASDFPAAGRITAINDGVVVFALKDSNYELHLVGGYTGALGEFVRGVVKGKARKIWTVPSGGNFIQPIFGTPRIVQGRVRHIDSNFIVIRSGQDVIVELPSADDALDLANGQIRVGAMANATLLPGATFELATQVVGV